MEAFAKNRSECPLSGALAGLETCRLANPEPHRKAPGGAVLGDPRDRGATPPLSIDEPPPARHARARSGDAIGSPPLRALDCTTVYVRTRSLQPDIGRAARSTTECAPPGDKRMAARPSWSRRTTTRCRRGRARPDDGHRRGRALEIARDPPRTNSQTRWCFFCPDRRREEAGLLGRGTRRPTPRGRRTPRSSSTWSARGPPARRFCSRTAASSAWCRFDGSTRAAP